MTAPTSCEIAILGGGLVGASLAFGLRDRGAAVVVLDEGDVAHRASRGNFGLVWVQGKGQGCAPYGNWTQRAAREWPRLAAEIRAETGIDVSFRQPGGLHVCLSREELERREAMFARLFAQPGFERHPLDVLDRDGVAARLPGLGPGVAGGTWCPLDGDCNPLRLLHALHAALRLRQVRFLPGRPATAIETTGSGFRIVTAQGAIEADRVVLAAGLGNATLAPSLGLSAPVKPNKGQILALERVAPFLPFPLETLRQTDEGTVLLGDSQQDSGYDDALALDVAGAIAARALAILPFLRDVRVNRAWAALRVMSPDGLPIYAESAAAPGAFLVTCHSGVTLASLHAFAVAPAIAAGALPAALAPFSTARFDDVRTAA